MSMMPMRALAAVLLLLPVSLFAGNGNSIQVTGHGELEAEPDIASLDFSIQGEADSARAATARADRIAGRLVEAIEKLGVKAEDIRSTPMSLHPFRDRQTQRELVRFDRTTTVTLRDLERLEVLQRAALDAGVNAIGGVRFGLSERRELFNRAIRKALENARSQAQTVAEATDVELGPVLSVTVSPSNDTPQPVVRELAMAGDAGPNFRTGRMVIAAEVEVHYAIDRH